MLINFGDQTNDVDHYTTAPLVARSYPLPATATLSNVLLTFPAVCHTRAALKLSEMSSQALLSASEYAIRFATAVALSGHRDVG